MADSDKLFKFGLLIAVGILVYYVVSGGTTATQTVTTTTQTNGGGAAIGGGGAVEFCDAGTKTTITFSGIDKYSKGTTVSQGHRVILFDGEKNIVYNNLGTNSYAAKSQYIVLMGNRTSNSTSETPYYYPTVLEGTTSCEGAKTLTSELVRASGRGELTFTYWDKQGTANTAQAVSANANNNQNFKYNAPDNKCFGNEFALSKSGKGNLICAYYNTTAFTNVEILDDKGGVLSTAGTPKSMTGLATMSVSCYDTKAVWCDNADYNYKVHYIAGNADIVNTGNITLVPVDVSVGYNTDTLDLIYGYEDAPNRNDLGVIDNGLPTSVMDDGLGTNTIKLS